MINRLSLLGAGLLACATLAAHAQAIVPDGTRDAAYGAAITVQTNTTGFGDATLGSQTLANGSELDAAYAHIANGNLYLLLTGNLETNSNRLELFFDTNTGAGQNVVAIDNPTVDGGALAKLAGMTFDAGFTADYYLTLNGTDNAGALALAAYFTQLTGAAGTGTTLTTGTTGPNVALAFGTGLNGELAINNANTGGVSDLIVGAPDTVRHGIELAIPLAALGSPTGDIRVMVFINGQNHDFASNQTLAGLPLGTGNLGGDGAGNFTGNLAGVNFTAFAGDQFFTIANGATVPVIAVSPTALAFGNTTVGSPATRQLVVRNAGNATLTVSSITSNNPLFSVAPTSGAVAVGDSLVVTVTFSPTAAGVQSGTLTIASNDPGQGTLTVSLTGTGVTSPAPVMSLSATTLSFGDVITGGTRPMPLFVRNTGTAPLIISSISSSNPVFMATPTTGTVTPGDSLLVTVNFSPTAVSAETGTLTIVSNVPNATVSLAGNGIAPPAIFVDGSFDPNYGQPLAVQTTPTGFGDANQGQVTTANGSELDAAYAYVENGILYLFLSGNLESNGNKLELFFDTQAGGQNTLTNGNPNVDNDGLNRMIGLTFDSGFAADYYLTANATTPGGALTLAAHYADLTSGGGGAQLGTGPGTNINLAFPGGLTGILGLNNSNTAGVSDLAVGSPDQVTTGIEWAIPLAAIGNPTGIIKVAAFVNGVQHDFVSNQVLAGLPNGTANLGDPVSVNFNTPTGNQFFTIPNGIIATADISASASSLTLTSSGVGTPSTRTLTLYSTGLLPLTINGITSSNPVFTVAPTTGTVQPGDSLVVTVTFTPTSTTQQTGTLTVASNAAGPQLTVSLTGDVVLGLTPDLASNVLLFPNPAPDGTATLRLTGPAATAGQATLLDALSRTVRQLATAPTLTLRDLTPGVYTLRLTTAAGVVTRRLVVR